MKNCLLFLVVLLFVTSAQAQKIGKEERKSKTTTITYSKIGGDSRSDVEFKNMLKIDPLAIFVGEIPINFERKLSEKLSVDLGLGLTHADYVFELGQTDGGTGNRVPQFGYSVSAALKYYPSYIFEEYYFGFEVRYKRFNTNIKNVCTTDNIDFYKENRNFFDVKLIGGYIWQLDGNVIFELWGGLGIRNRVINSHICNDSGPIGTYAPSQIRDTRLAPALGFRVGFGF